MHNLLILCSLIPFYLLGSFPTGHLISKARGIEISKVGSGNVGATNVGRVLGKKAGLLTLFGDMLKGALAVYLASLLSDSTAYTHASAVAVVAGHCFSIPGKLQGGKGVATALGALLCLSPATALFSLAIFGAVFEMWKMVSLASVSAVFAAPLFSMLTAKPDTLSLALALIAAIITFRHRSNLSRIAHGKEPRSGAASAS